MKIIVETYTIQYAEEIQGKKNDGFSMELRRFERLKVEAKVGVSARKLAASLWQCGLIHPLHIWIPVPKSAMKGTTKWDPGHLRMSGGVNRSYGLVKLHESQHTANTSVDPALQVELVRARNSIRELEAERGRLRQRFKHFMRKQEKVRTSWMRRERQKTHAVIDDLKDGLRRERRDCKRLDVVNSKFLIDLADSKSSSRRYMHDYEKERKSKELLEDVCNELDKEIEDDKAEIEALKSENSRVGEEIEEERKMLQLSEVWREERAQMKLIDAKLIFEEKYCLMSNLISEIESFLRSNNVTVDMTDSNVQVVKQVVGSSNIQEIEEFFSSSLISNDIYTTNEGSITCDAKKLGSKQCADYSTCSHSSAIQIVGNESKTCDTNNSSQSLNRCLDHDKSCKDVINETEHFVNGIDGGRYILSGKANHEQNTGESSSLDFETSEISSVFSRKSKKKGSSFRKLWRSSLSFDDFCKTISLDESGRFSNGSTHNVDIISSENVPAEREIACQDFVNHCCSGGPRNPHITRAIKGCIKWPRGIPKYGLKSKLLETRFESQKSQWRNILKHRS